MSFCCYLQHGKGPGTPGQGNGSTHGWVSAEGGHMGAVPQSLCKPWFQREPSHCGSRLGPSRLTQRPQRSRHFWPGHLEPLREKWTFRSGFERFCPCRSILGFPQEQKGISFFPEPCSRPGASCLCAGCSRGTSQLCVSPRSFPARGAVPAQPTRKPRKMGTRLNPKPVIKPLVQKDLCKKGFTLL